MWGLGLIAFQLLTGRPLFAEDMSEQHILSMLVGCALHFISQGRNCSLPRVWIFVH